MEHVAIYQEQRFISVTRNWAGHQVSCRKIAVWGGYFLVWTRNASIMTGEVVSSTVEIGSILELNNEITSPDLYHLECRIVCHLACRSLTPCRCSQSLHAVYTHKVKKEIPQHSSKEPTPS